MRIFLQKTLLRNVHGGTGTKHEECNVMEHLRNTKEAPSTEVQRMLRNFQYWPKFLVAYKNTCITDNSSHSLIYIFKYFDLCNVYLT